jgi:hypothetical protein
MSKGAVWETCHTISAERRDRASIVSRPYDKGQAPFSRPLPFTVQPRHALLKLTVSARVMNRAVIVENREEVRLEFL